MAENISKNAITFNRNTSFAFKQDDIDQATELIRLLQKDEDPRIKSGTDFVRFLQTKLQYYSTGDKGEKIQDLERKLNKEKDTVLLFEKEVGQLKDELSQAQKEIERLSGEHTETVTKYSAANVIQLDPEKDKNVLDFIDKYKSIDETVTSRQAVSEVFGVAKKLQDKGEVAFNVKINGKKQTIKL